MLANTNQGGVIPVEREATGAMAVQIQRNKDKYLLVTL
jgi:hypothetical protein